MGNSRWDPSSLTISVSRHPNQAGSGVGEETSPPHPLGLGRLGAEELLPDLWKKFVPSDEEKCEWIRSQIPGRSVEFLTEFGTSRLLTYADHTASGQPLIHIENTIAQVLLPFYGNTHTEDSHVGKMTGHAVEEAGQFIKRCLGGTKEEAIFFCGSGTTAALKRLQDCLGIAVPSFLRTRVLRMLDDEEKWVVFVGPFEHHSNLLSWRESLAEVVEIPLRADGSGVDMTKLKAALANPKYKDRPKLGSFSAASNVTGILTDTRAIARLLHLNGAFACFDFAASGPYVKIDMRAGRLDGYDAVVLSPHKFAGGPGSPGILLMSKALYLLKDTAPSTCGGGTVQFVDYHKQVYMEDVESREDAGTPPIIQKVRAALTFWVKELMGYDLIQQREEYFITTAIQRLQRNPYIHILGNTDVKRCAILSFTVRSRDPISRTRGFHRRSLGRPGLSRVGKLLHCRFVVKLLNDLFGIQARGGCSCAGPYGLYLLGIDPDRSLAIEHAVVAQGYSAMKPGWARLSFGYYITEDEFQFLLSAMEFVAEHGQRFLPLYDLDWITGEWSTKPTVKDIIIPCNGFASTVLWGDKDSRFSHDVYTGSEEAMEVGGLPAVAKYSMYLEAATTMATFLDEFPDEERGIPQGLDPSRIDFRL